MAISRADNHWKLWPDGKDLCLGFGGKEGIENLIDDGHKVLDFLRCVPGLGNGNAQV